MGHLNPQKVAKMDEKRLEKLIRNPKSLHRFPKKMAKWLIESSKYLVTSYQGRPENVWNDEPRVEDLQSRFDAFDGIGQKKSSMATNILVRDYQIPVKDVDYRGIDISPDVHVRRVFRRTGLMDRDSESEVVKVARRLNPRYPGELDLPAWFVGRTFCHPKAPACHECPLCGVCIKRIHLNAKTA